MTSSTTFVNIFLWNMQLLWLNMQGTGTSIIFDSDSPALYKQHLPLLLKNVLGTLPGNGHCAHAIPTLCVAGHLIVL